MDSIGTLKILIEADSAGLTSQLKRATNSITSFVGSMNKQEVNWTSILSRTISPAIISGIAATFALAIGETLSFQNTMSNVAMSGSQAFSDNLGAAGQSVLGLSTDTGVGMQSMASASAFLSHYIDANSSAFKSFTSEVGAFAYDAGIDYRTLLEQTLPTMKDWGIKADNMSSSLNDLVSASQVGVVPLDELSSALDKSADGLRKSGVSMKDVAFYLEELSTIVPKDDAVKMISAIGQAAANSLDPMNLLLGGPAWVERTLKAQGMQGVLNGIVSKLGEGGITAQQLGIAMGLSPETLKSIKDYSSEITNLKPKVDGVEKSMTSLKAKTEELNTPAKELGKVWNNLKNDLVELATSGPVSKFLEQLLGGIDSSVKGLTGSGPVKASDFFEAFGKNLFNVLSLGTAGMTNFAGLYDNSPSSGNKSSSTTNNTTNINIAPQSVGGGSGVHSVAMDNALYVGMYGINKK